MKKIIAALSIVVVSATVALAGWLEDFQTAYEAENIQVAVEGALEQGTAPAEIIESALGIESLNPQNLVKALYCAGVNGIDINAAAKKYKISEDIVIAGHKQSVAECGDQVVDAQAYPNNNSRFFNPPPNGNGNGHGPRHGASPFQPEPN
ncbi:hypothetical protein [Desulfosediminicola sp.]|uniref:hypothetical protein n=1 Tax=Desulfosediminicola sp. TaxID=2886825 RepID=UPI003AF2B857